MLAATDERTERIDREVKRSQFQAIGYVWGRQDMGEPGDTIRSIDFGMAYGARKRAYLTQESCWLPNIRDAYEEWARTGAIS